MTLVEYGDYECPACRQAFRVLRDVEDRFRGELRFVYRHFPLTEVHPLAMIAAEAAEAAAAQGRFWAMHDTLFDNAPELEPEQLIAYAGELDLDIDAFAADLGAQRYRQVIREHFMGGVRSGVNGTPCLFINDARYDGPLDATLLARALEDSLGHRYAQP